MALKGGPICISVINMKGGVGKTTIAALLGRYAALRLNLKVLAIDLDPQANLSQAFMGEQLYRQFINDKSTSIVEIFKGYQPPTSSRPSPTPLDVTDTIVSNTVLGGPNLELIPSRFDFADNLIGAVRPDPHVLARHVADNFQAKDLVIIDCAPTESILTHVAYHASRYILVPVKPEYFATIGFPLLKDSLTAFRKSNRGNQIRVIGVVINNSWYDDDNDGGPEKRRAVVEINNEARKNKWHVLDNEIPFSRGFPKIMRGDFSHSGDAPSGFDSFASELFNRHGLRGLGNKGVDSL